MTLRDWLGRAQSGRFAIGHFNVSNLEAVKAIAGAAVRLRAPVIIGVSEGEREFIGTRQIAALVRSYREQYGWPIFLNADHTKSFEKIREAVDAGFDSVHFDGSALAYEDNIHETKKAVEYSKSRNAGISVEGELGFLRGESKIQEAVEIKAEDMTDPEQARDFVEKTGIDRLAPVLGNIHGIVVNQKEKLDIELLRRIRKNTDAFLVLHGASGLKDEDVLAAIGAGIVKVHINTELRVLYRKALEKTFKTMPDETTPYKYLVPAVGAIQGLVEEKIKLFGSANRT